MSESKYSTSNQIFEEYWPEIYDFIYNDKPLPNEKASHVALALLFYNYGKHQVLIKARRESAAFKALLRYQKKWTNQRSALLKSKPLARAVGKYLLAKVGHFKPDTNNDE